MTALCGGGASQTLPGVGVRVVITSGLITGALLAASPWLFPFAALFDGFMYEALTQCPNDPPAMPTFDSSDVTNLVGGILNPNWGVTATKVHNALLNYFWYQYCGCVSGSPSPAFVAPAAPPTVTFPGGTGPSLPCFSGTLIGTPIEYTTPVNSRQDLPILEAPGARSTATYGAGVTQTIQQLPSPAPLSIRMLGTATYPANGTQPLNPAATWFDASKTFISNAGIFAPFVAGTTQSFDTTFAVPSNAVWCAIEVAQTNEAHPCTADVQAIWQCAGGGGTVATPCKTDPAVLELLRNILDLATLLQRQLAPFAYIFGAAHPGLSGSGSFPVQGLLGVKIALTTIPTQLLQDQSVPPFIFTAGWVSMLDSNGFIDETRAHAATQVWMSRIASDATLVGYSFPPGVVATITELNREP